MNKINCPKCGFANETDLNFCLNCGAALHAQSAPLPSPQIFGAPTQPNAPPQTAFGASNSNVAAKPARGGAGRNLAIFGGLGCIGLALGAVALLGLLYYIGSNANNKNARNVSVANADRAANRLSNAANKIYNSNSGSASDPTLSGVSDANASGNSASGGGEKDTLTEAQTEKLLAAQLGNFKRQGEIDFNAAIEMNDTHRVSSADYTFNNKSLEVFVVEFVDAPAAKTGYTDFLADSRASAKILKRERTATKTNDKGEYVIYTFKANGKTRYESLFYSGKYAFHFIAPDQLTLTLFLVAFAANAQAVGQ